MKTSYQRGVKLDGIWSRGRAILELFECTVEEHLIQPTIIKDMPKESTPLCKRIAQKLVLLSSLSLMPMAGN